MSGNRDGVRYQHRGRNDELSERQLQVLALVARGFPDEEIGAALFISGGTAKRHVRDILCKLDARNRAHAVHIAHKKGILK